LSIAASARFGLIWFSGFRGEVLNVMFYQNMPNLHNRYESAERKISQKNLEYTQKPLGQLQPNFGGMVFRWTPSKFVSGDSDFQPIWPPS
jgi:hypothetical protein